MEDNRPKLDLYPVFLFIDLVGFAKKYHDGPPIVAHDTITQKLKGQYRDYCIVLNTFLDKILLTIERVTEPLDTVIAVKAKWIGEKTLERGLIHDWHIVEMLLLNLNSRPREYDFLLRIVGTSETLRSLDFRDDYPGIYFDNNEEKYDDIESMSGQLHTKLYHTKGEEIADVYKKAEKFTLPFIKKLLLNPPAKELVISDKLGPGNGIYSMPSSLSEGMEGGAQFAKE